MPSTRTLPSLRPATLLLLAALPAARCTASSRPLFHPGGPFSALRPAAAPAFPVRRPLGSLAAHARHASAAAA